MLLLRYYPISAKIGIDILAVAIVAKGLCTTVRLHQCQLVTAAGAFRMSDSRYRFDMFSRLVSGLQINIREDSSTASSGMGLMTFSLDVTRRLTQFLCSTRRFS